MAFACSIPYFPNDSQAKNRDTLRFEIRADYGRFIRKICELTFRA
jgi:hypothetical protein